MNAPGRLSITCIAAALMMANLVGCDRSDAQQSGKSNPSGKTLSHKQEQSHENDDHGDHGPEKEAMVRLSATELAEAEIEIAEAKPVDLKATLNLSGEIVFNPDRVAHVSPRVGGVVRDVFKTVGDKVAAGDILAMLDSREFAESKGSYIAALEREQIAATNFKRERKLWEEKINAEKDYLAAKQAQSEARIQRELAERELYALGMSKAEVVDLADAANEQLTRYELRAPIGGLITERHFVRGEVVKTDAEAPPFVVSDLSTVWVNLTIYPKDIHLIRVGLPATIGIEHGGPEASGVISYVSPSLSESTRTGLARVVIDNPDNKWKPGLFVFGRVVADSHVVAVGVERDALQTIDGQTVVFVRTDEGFEPRPVKTGRMNRTHVEIVEGLSVGERYVHKNAFTLKAELAKGSFDAHGHAH